MVGKRILVIDDDPEFLEMMRMLLGDGGMDPIVTAETHAAVDIVRDQDVAAVVLDLRMPEQSGWQVLNALRNEKQTSSVPVIVCSAAGSELARIQVEMNDSRTYVIGKPFEIDELLTRIADAIVLSEE
jgi:DNA-binding response OmpR family regulator